MSRFPAVASQLWRPDSPQNPGSDHAKAEAVCPCTLPLPAQFVTLSLLILLIFLHLTYPHAWWLPLAPFSLDLPVGNFSQGSTWPLEGRKEGVGCFPLAVWDAGLRLVQGVCFLPIFLHPPPVKLLLPCFVFLLHFISQTSQLEQCPGPLTGR